MVFWIIAGIAAVIFIGGIIYTFYEGDGAAAGICALFAVVVALVGTSVLMLATSLFGWTYITDTHEETYSLRALDTGSEINGRFFLGSGYIDGERTLNYIKQVDSWAKVSSAPADDSRIFEDETEDPAVIETVWTWGNPWLFPWGYGKTYNYDFHVPAESVVEDFSISNQ